MQRLVDIDCEKDIECRELADCNLIQTNSTTNNTTTNLIVSAARGRTNVELREQFILPEGASQAMAAFRTKMAKDPATVAALGPITKVCHQ